MLASEFIQSLTRPRSAAVLKISGSYILESYDENLEHWLDSLKVDGAELGQVFRETKVKVMVQEPSKFNKKWSLIHKEEGGKSS